MSIVNLIINTADAVDNLYAENKVLRDKLAALMEPLSDDEISCVASYGEDEELMQETHKIILMRLDRFKGDQ